MPCYEPTPRWIEQERAFLRAALCHTIKHVPADQIDAIPGLAEWKRRHDAIDAACDKAGAAREYDSRDGRDPYYDGPLYMTEFMRGPTK